MPTAVVFPGARRIWLVTHEAPSAHSCGFRALDDLAVHLGAKLVAPGHHHESIDHLEAGLITADSPFLVHGVDKGDFFVWPLEAPR